MHTSTAVAVARPTSTEPTARVEVLELIDKLLDKHGNDRRAFADEFEVLIADDDKLFTTTLMMLGDYRAFQRPRPAAKATSALTSKPAATSAPTWTRSTINPAAARAAVARASAAGIKGLLGTFQLLDGRLLAEVRWGELPALIQTGERQNHVLKRVYNHYAKTSIDPSAKVGEVIKTSFFEKIVREAEEGIKR